MGRARIAMEFIRKDQKREVTFQKRKKGLLKKAHEFSVLCNLPVCVIIYPYNKVGDNPQSQLPEVYTFKGNEPSRIDLARAMDPKLAREIIDRYLAFTKADERNKRSLDLKDMFQERKRKADQELYKLRHKNARVAISQFSVEQLMELVSHLDHKLDSVKEKIAVIKNNNAIIQGINALVPSASRMMIADDNGNNNNNSRLAPQEPGMGMFNQFVGFEPTGPFVDHNEGGCNFGYKMEPNYVIDQGPENVGNHLIPSSNGFGGRLPISVPFHYFPMFSNHPFPKFN